MLAAGTVLDEAGYETVFLIGRHDERGHRGLTKLTERFEAPLTANKIIERAIFAMAAGYGDRALEADFGDVLDDPLEHLLVADARIDDGEDRKSKRLNYSH